MQPYPRTWLEIDLSAIRHNLAVIRGKIADDSVEVALVTKADAYGHGLVPVSRYALRNGADWAAVATVQEGIALRDAGIDSPVMALSPILPIEAEQAVFYDLDVLTENLETAQALSRAAESTKRSARVHLKVDTGLHRFGCTAEEAASLGLAVRGLPGVELVGIAQHFADSARDEPFTRVQIERWNKVLETCRDHGLEFRHVHAANSAAAVKYRECRGNLVRVGILGYGIDVFDLLDGALVPALTWHARITAIRNVPAGDAVGYSGTYRVDRPTVTATVGAGYGDGYPRTLSSKGFVETHGQRAKVMGLVCMDQIMVDVTDIPGVRIGDEVRLIGPVVTAAELAVLAQTNGHEIVTRIMSRVPRRYTGA